MMGQLEENEDRAHDHGQLDPDRWELLLVGMFLGVTLLACYGLYAAIRDLARWW